MSDTNALYDVVAKALANWGNAEAMDAFEELVGPLRQRESYASEIEDALQRASEAAGVDFPATVDDVARAVEALKVRATRAEADNAALLDVLKELSDLMTGVYDGSYTPDSFTLQPAELALSSKHPGAALLEEVEGLRKQVASLKESVELLRADRAAAHNAALEEAAKRMRELAADAQRRNREYAKSGNYAASDAWIHSRGAYESAETEIRALKKTGQGE